MISQRQAVPQVDAKGIVNVGDADRTGLLMIYRVKHSPDKEEGAVTSGKGRAH